MSIKINGNPRATDVFKDKLQNNPIVCSDCFSILKVYHEVKDQWGKPVMTTVEGKNTERAKVDSPTEWACSECGPIDERCSKSWREGPLSMGELCGVIENISETLDEFGIEYDEHRMKRIAEELKSSPEMSGKDDEILHHAVNEGVESDMEMCPDCGKMFLKQSKLRSHYNISHGKTLPGTANDYGDWKKVRRKILQRDEGVCQICGRGEDEIGRSPDIHHITPLREFDKSADANEPDNLIALCPKHHMMVEYGELSASNVE